MPPSSKPVTAGEPNQASPVMPRFQVDAGPSRKEVKDKIIERFEQKYIIHPALVPKIREYIKPFCIADPNGKGKNSRVLGYNTSIRYSNNGSGLGKRAQNICKV